MNNWLVETQTTKNCGFEPFYTGKERKCQMCGFSNVIEIHHIISISEGGAHSDKNIIIVCPNHHRMLTNGEIKIDDIGEKRYTEEEMIKAMELFNAWCDMGEESKVTYKRVKAWIQYLLFIKNKSIDRIDIICYMMGIGRHHYIKNYSDVSDFNDFDKPDFEPNKKMKIEKYLKKLHLEDLTSEQNRIQAPSETD